MLHDFAAVAPLPTYPPLSIVCGVAVAQFELEGSGRVLTRDVLESPDGETRQSVRLALEKWKFRQIAEPDDLRGVVYRGKITFYFVNFSGRPNGGRVAWGLEAPNISECKSRTPGAQRVTAKVIY